MKNSIFYVICLGVISACSLLERRGAQPAAAVETREATFEVREPESGLRHRILVLPFIDERSDRSQKVTEEARRTVLKELAKTGQFVMVSPEEFPQDIKKYLNVDGDYDIEQVARLAAGMGISAVLEGKVLEIRARRMGDQVGLVRELRAKVDAQIRLRMAAGKNGHEILNETRSGSVESVTTRLAENSTSDRQLSEDPDLVRQAVRKAVAGSLPAVVRAVEKLAWEGRVAMVAGDRVYVNAGRLSGIQMGDILKVTEDGDEVFDPETGRFIGKAPGRMKGTIEIISYFGKDGAIGVVHSGSGFKENDRVELY